MSLKILGSGSFIPSKKVTNQELFQKISNFDIERAKISLVKKAKIKNIDQYSQEDIFSLWVEQVCGIKERVFLSELDNLESKHEVEGMAAAASKKAIADANLTVNDIDYIIFSTYSAEAIVPPPVCKLKELLEIRDKNVSGITINAVCNGFIEAMRQASLYLQTKRYKNILVVASEYMSNKIDFADPPSSILFADAAGACVVSSTERITNGEASQINYSPQINMKKEGYICLSGGPLVERHAVNSMFEILNQAIEKSNIEFEDISIVIPHQANGRIIESLKEKILKEHPSTKVINVIEKLGNLSSASIVVALDKLRHNDIPDFQYQSGQIISLTGVGGGYNYGSIVIEA